MFSIETFAKKTNPLQSIATAVLQLLYRKLKSHHIRRERPCLTNAHEPENIT